MDAFPPPAEPVDWGEALRRALAGVGAPTLVFQPIVDLARGDVAGYECLSRFPGPPQTTPDVWFDEAQRLGLGAELDAAVVTAALRWRDALPPNTFLTVNVRPGTIGSGAVRAALRSADGLHRVVVELTEQDPIDETPDVLAALNEIREAGGMVAVDDAGAGYAGLRALLALRPQLIKLDRGLISDLDVDPAKRALVAMLGRFADEVDAWILGEGIERVGELEDLVRLGVPLGQGYLLGRPAPRLTTVIPPEPAVALRLLTERVLALRPDAVGTIVEAVEPADGLVVAAAAARVQVDGHGRPAALSWAGDPIGAADLLRVKADEGVAEVARRAMARDAVTRFAPVVCCDDVGRYVGLIRVERLVEVLSGRSSDAA